MRIVALLLALAVPASSAAQVVAVAHLEFHSAFWPNLHHTLYAAAAPANRPLPSPASGDVTASMTAAERAAWSSAVAYYAHVLAAKDLRVGDGMAEITEVLSQAGDQLTASSVLAPEHVAALRAVAPAYRRVLWPSHDRANRDWIRDVAGKLDQIAPVVVPRLSRAYATPWFSAPHRVDVTFHGRAYTYGRPAWHTVMASGDPHYAGWAGAEMTLHEGSHALVGRLDETIAVEAAAARREADLGHLAMFYLVGEATRQALASRGIAYTPYLYAVGVIDRAWPSQRGIVEAHLKPYLDDASMPMAPAMRGWIQATPLFAFRSGFWNNLHHFLYVLGRHRNGAPDRLRDAVVNAPKDVEGLSARPESDRAAWDEAIAYYAAGLSTKDAVFNGELIAVTGALASASDDSDLSGLGLDAALVAALRKAAPVYRVVWWPRHKARNEERRQEYQALVDKYGREAVSRLTALYGTKWPAAPRTIDLVAYANWAGAYSTTGPLIEIASVYENTGGAIGLEILLHESSHQWDDEIQGRLAAAGARLGKRVPGQLSHALIWYTTGTVVTSIVPGHVPYAVKYGLWNGGGLAALKPLLDRDWRPYLEGKGTFEEAIAAILAGAEAIPFAWAGADRCACHGSQETKRSGVAGASGE
jgi:hypothetical protein